MKPPSSLTLSASEAATLAALTRHELSAYQFWQRAFAGRGIKCPPDRIPVTIPTDGNTYRLEWHRKALGPQAIAAGHAYRTYQAKKDQEFAGRLQRQGKGIW